MATEKITNLSGQRRHFPSKSSADLVAVSLGMWPPSTKMRLGNHCLRHDIGLWSPATCQIKSSRRGVFPFPISCWFPLPKKDQTHVIHSRDLEPINFQLKLTLVGGLYLGPRTCQCLTLPKHSKWCETNGSILFELHLDDFAVQSNRFQ